MLGAYSNLRFFLSDHTGFTSDLPKPLLIKEKNRSPPFYIPGESQRGALMRLQNIKYFVWALT